MKRWWLWSTILNVILTLIDLAVLFFGPKREAEPVPC